MADPTPIGLSLAQIETTIPDAAFMPGDDNPEPPPADTRLIRWATICPARFTTATLDDLDDLLQPTIASWCQTAATNLVLLGPTVGAGKTHAALAAARQRFMNAGDDVTFWPTVELLDALRPGGPDNAMAGACDTDVLVLDDLGAERPTDWTAERLFAVVNRRWMEQRPIIATSNLDPAGLREMVGDRTYSRLVGSAAVVVGVGGPDRRRL